MKAVRGVAWMVVTGVIARAIGLVGTLVLVRFVSPNDYGEFAVASALVMTCNTLSTVGVGPYIIANREMGRDEVFHATLINGVFAFAAFAVAVVFARPLAPFFGAPTIVRYVPGFALAILIDRISYVPERLLVRNMEYDRISIARTVGELTYTVVSVGLAWRGWGGMSMVVGNLARTTLKGAIFVASVKGAEWLTISPIRPALIRKLMVYGITVTLFGAAYVALGRWDNLLVSRFFGPTILGAYNLAYNFADIPATQVGEQIADVMFTSFAQMGHDDRRQALVRSMGVLALIMFPLGIGLGAVAPTLAGATLDQRWAATGSMLAVLSVLSVAKPVAAALASFMMVQYGPRLVVVLEVASLAALIAAISTVGRLGPLWTCGAVIAVFLARSLLAMRMVRPAGISTASLLRKLAPPLVACAPMVAAIVLVRRGIAPLGWSGATRSVIEVATGMLSYVAAAPLIARDATRDAVSLVQRMLARRRRPASAAE
jgi:PST family polysaccharide transporter